MAGTKNHDYHILPASAWPIIGAFASLALTGGGIMWMHDNPYGKFVFALVVPGSYRLVAALEDGHACHAASGDSRELLLRQPGRLAGLAEVETTGVTSSVRDHAAGFRYGHWAREPRDPGGA